MGPAVRGKLSIEGEGKRSPLMPREARLILRVLMDPMGLDPPPLRMGLCHYGETISTRQTDLRQSLSYPPLERIIPVVGYSKGSK